MYLLGYYDETDCQITLFETGIIKFKKAQKILQEKVVKYLEQHGCNCAERIFEKAQREQGFYIDGDSQIEIKVEESLVYIKMENQSPYFATFQILSMGNIEDQGYRGR